MQKIFGASLAVAIAGLASGASAAPPTIISYPTAITSDTVWGDVPDEAEIILSGAIFVKNGATLTILPGVVVRGQPRTAAAAPGITAGTPGALIVTQNGQLVAEGQPNNPIIMTTAAVDNDGNGEPDNLDGDSFLDAYPGYDPVLSAPLPCTKGVTCVADATPTYYDATPKTNPLSPLSPSGRANVQLWGGFVLLGNAPTNLGNEQALGFGKGTIEGLTVPGFAVADCTYGGLLPHDSSGSIKYLSIRYAGDEIGASNELNGVSLGGVGDGTTLEHIEVYVNFDDGFEWFGGTANGKYLIAAYIGDDSFDQDQGYTGVNQYLLALQTFFRAGTAATPVTFGSADGDKLCELDGDDAGSDPGFPNNVTTRSNETGANDEIAAPPAPGWPFSNPAMYNATLIGERGATVPADNARAAANTGCQMRNGFAGDVLNSIVLSASTAAFVLDVTANSVNGGLVEAADNVNNGFTRIVATSMNNNAAALNPSLNPAISNGDTYAASVGGGANVLNGSPFSGLVQSDISFDPNGPGNSGHLSGAKPGLPGTPTGPIDPRPAGATGTTGAVPSAAPGADSVSFRGAFDPTQPQLWSTGWTALNRAGVLAN